MGTATGLPVFLVPARSFEWMLSLSRAGWALLLHRLDETVQRALTVSATGKVTLVGHSAAGVVSRLYLSPERFEGQACGGYRSVAHLITLGTPHNSRSHYDAQVRQWVDATYPGAYFAPDVCYSSVIGKHRRGNRHGGLWERVAYRSYGALTGQPEDWGDGIVPISSALLEGSNQCIIDGAAHFWGLYGLRAPWYGSGPCVRRWWLAAWQHATP